MKIAKATQQDFDELHAYLQRAEARGGKKFPHGWRRIVWGYDTLVKNCCDPSADVLEFSPEIKKALEQVTA